jgi:hypothetical protein
MMPNAMRSARYAILLNSVSKVIVCSFLGLGLD